MVVINGKGASSGVVMGKLKILTRKKGRTKRAFTDEAREIDRLEKAAAITAREYTTLYESTKNRYGEKEAAIFEIHSMMLEEEEFLEAAREEIRQRKKTAETAVERAGEVMASMFQKMDTEYMKARAADVRAVAGRVAEILRGENHGVVLTEPCILAADDLTPAETVLLDKSMVLGFVTERGSEMSHTAILARMMAIPAVVATGNMLDRISESTQNYAVFQFASTQKGGETYALKNEAGEEVLTCRPENAFMYLIFSTEDMAAGTYTLWQGENQLAGSSGTVKGGFGGFNDGMPGGFGGQMSQDGERTENMEIPEGMERPGHGEVPESVELPEDMTPPEGMEFPEDMQRPEGTEVPENMERPEGGRGGNMFGGVSDFLQGIVNHFCEEKQDNHGKQENDKYGNIADIHQIIT